MYVNDGAVLHGFVRFARHVRSYGIPVAPAKMLDLIRTVPACDLRTPDDFYWAARCLLVERHDDLRAFDDAFASFWRPEAALGVPEKSPHALPRVLKELPAGDGGELLGRPERGEPQNRRFGKATRSLIEETEPGAGDGGGMLSYSETETLRHKDFAHVEPDELAAVQRLLATLNLAVAQRRSRRLRPAHNGRTTDWRRTLRRNIKYGGTPLELAYAQPKTVRRPVVLLCDVSGSMDRYTRLLLHFVHSLKVASGSRLETFLFGTRLTRVTRDLTGRNIDRALRTVSANVPDWSGGTRIGTALREFNRGFARRLLGRGAVTIVISDGWDNGDPHALATEVASLQRRSYRLIWINPALGTRQQRPLATGMQAALPYVDDFLAASNVASLAQLGGMIGALHAGRGVRGRFLQGFSHR